MLIRTGIAPISCFSSVKIKRGHALHKIERRNLYTRKNSDKPEMHNLMDPNGFPQKLCKTKL